MKKLKDSTFQAEQIAQLYWTLAHLMPCSFQVGPRWTKPKVDSTSRLICCFRLCAEVETIDHYFHSPADLEGSSKGRFCSALIFPCLSKSCTIYASSCNIKYTKMKESAFCAHCSGREKNNTFEVLHLQKKRNVIDIQISSLF